MLTKAPRIYGGTYAIDNTEGTATMYDGTLEGVTAPVNGSINAVAGYAVAEGTETLNPGKANEIVYITKYLVSE